MATYEQASAIIAVVVVLAIFGAGMANTGAATAGLPDFYATAVTFPAIKEFESFTAEGAFVNTGALTATFVPYKYSIRNAQGTEVYRNRESDFVHLTPGESTSKLTTVDFLRKGAYAVTVEIDSGTKFDESNENNNVFTTTFTIV